MQPRSSRKEKIYIYGKHALEEALMSAPAAVKKAFLARTLPEAAALRRALEKHRIPVAELAVGTAGSMVGRDAAHQGVIAIVEPAELMRPLDDFLATLDRAASPAIAILAELQDPGNVGAIIRSAAALGLAGVLIPKDRQAPITGAVVKASAGMAFRIPLVEIGNVNAALETLKKSGFWVYGLAMEGAPLAAERFDRPTAFVIGNEGEGLRRVTRETCDQLLAIPMRSGAESLNAAVSASIAFYEWSRGRAL
ncbi:MAG: 23S rRNA (guanosine(2251)-2'-O)-methyltransferase RlmB [Patescibacteria group bacterium]|nr:23S rRNA (guanosine(2251)-2'-O)-methyltransferase RlmB [Patescibacteria group bacterium]MDE1944341.1 23S rRNA (guanosine(2251)-2'-O)-methyltransferase RlmB [Patescibacteria group bacterium]MDE1945335.1 23S rRNA (guanosine(2251)-2'-O)-methyltransferase RlmB [Patescibacteria group bacterium]MDE2057691.1 23S rRNA (guanosine(2251)-2'-O)-methyltransferase RlmB [Patescibacteria group bacterium]